MFKKILSSQLRVNMLSGIITAVINAVVLAVAYPMCLYFLGYEKYGIWLILTTILTVAQLGDIGINQAVVKLVAEEYGRDDINAIQYYVTTALAMLCISGAVVLSAILIFKTQIIALFKLGDGNAEMVSWLLPYVGVLSVYVFTVHAFNSVLSGLGRMDLANYIQSAGKILGVGTAAVLLYIGWDLKSLLIASALSYVFIQIASYICIRRIANINFLNTVNFDAKRGIYILKFGVAVFGGSIIGMLLNPFNKLMISRHIGVAAITIYDMAYTGSMQIRTLFETGLRALMPEISRIGVFMNMQTRNRISQLNRQAMKFIFFFSVPVYIVLMFFMPVLLRLWLGDRFMEILPGAFRIMMVAAFFTLVGIPAYYTVMGLGKIRYFITASIIGVGGNIFLVFAYCALFNSFSVNGIGFCITVSYAVSTVYLICTSQRCIHIE
jgi:O-antigen/teichoic acid export membrane protein